MTALAFGLQCDRTYLRALGAVARRHPAAGADLVDLVERVTAVDAQIAAQPSPLAGVAARLALGPALVDFVWTAAALTADARIAPHAEALTGPHARRGLSLDLHAELAELSGEQVRALARELNAGTLVDHGLLVDAEAGPVIAARSFAVPPRVVEFLAGGDAFDPTIKRIEPGADDLFAPSQTDALALLERALVAEPAPVIVVEGAPGSGRRTAVARAAFRSLAVLDGQRLRGAALAGGLIALRRELVLGDVVPVIADIEDAIREPAVAAMLARFVDGVDGPVVVVAHDGGLALPIARPVVRVRWPIPDVATRVALWQRHVDGIDVAPVAQRYRLGPGGIARAVASARAISDGALGESSLVGGIRHNVAERMTGLAQRVDVTQSWDDVVLVEDTWDQVRSLIGRVRHAYDVLETWKYRGKIARGVGVPVLFSGPPGTGKTMVAGLIARELDLELYQVDLGQVVSKWVGETEKHLSRLFDAAEEGHALLLFDEADALFGQRSTEMRGATDRYANLEVNFLLQRVEAFGGITILTTNLEASIDRALKRRLAAHIVFDAPDEDERVLLWKRMTTTGAAPLAADIDYADLARDFPNMTGANIRNAALSAAYLAAGERSQRITRDHLIRAARSEYRSMGHVLADRSLSMTSNAPKRALRG
jgi:AAA+ superfamily predicted ATPase